MGEEIKIPQVRATLEPLSDDAVKVMHALKIQRIERRVRGASKESVSPDLEKELINYLKEASAESIFIPDEKLKWIATAKTPFAFRRLFTLRGKMRKDVAEFTREMVYKMRLKNPIFGFLQDPTKLLNQFNIAARAEKQAVHTIHQDIFGDRKRIYFRLKDESDSLVQDMVVDHIRKATNEEIIISDEEYQEGYFIDGRKNVRRIGRALKDKPSLMQVFQEDPVRGAKDLVVVLSRHPLDIAKASYKRSWVSCVSDLGSSVELGGYDAGEGCIIAYLVKRDDPDISNPLARVMLKPYHLLSVPAEVAHENNEEKVPVLYRAFKPIGLYHPAFYRAVVDFIEDKINAHAMVGDYKLANNCDSYKESRFTKKFSSDVRTNLALLKTPYTISEDGRIIVEDLNVENLGLNVLPDFRSVFIENSFNCSNNNICDLQGSPVNEMKYFRCRDTMITTFEGAPNHVTGELNYSRTPHLSSLTGIPQAKIYTYGNYEMMYDNTKSKKPSVRALNVGLFPRFKKKAAL